MAGFGDLWGAEKEGQDAEQSAIASGYLDRANAALVNHYGPEAGNPEAQAQLEQTNYFKQLHPLLLTQQGNNNIIGGVQAHVAQATQDSTAAATNANNVAATQIAPTTVDQAQSNASLSNTAAKGAQADLAAKTSAIHVSAGIAAANSLAAYLKANPGDTEGAWKAGIDAANGVALGEGSRFALGTPEGDAAHAVFAKDPQGFINNLNQVALSKTAALYGSATPVERATINKSNQELAKAQGDVLDQTQKAFQFARDNEKEILGNQGPMGAGVVAADDAAANIAKMRKLVNSLPGSSVWNDTIGKHIPGGTMTQLEALSESVGGAMSVQMMNGLREASASGSGMSGIRSTTEFNKVGDQFMKIDPSMTKDQLMAQLDQGEKAINAFRMGATNLLYGPNGKQELRNATARRVQAENALNQAQGVIGTPDAPSGAAASPAAPASPPAAAGASPTPRLGGDTAPAAPAKAAPGTVPIGSFSAALDHTFGAEGGYNAKDANGAEVNMGINAAAHPGEDVKNMTRERASEIYKTEYWDPIGGDKLAKENPGMAHAGFDIAVIDGAGRAKELIAKADGDPNKLVDLQQQFQNSLIAKDPSRYGRYADVWQKRNAALKNDIASGSVGSAYAEAGSAGSGGGTAPAAGAAIPQIPTPTVAPITGGTPLNPAAGVAPVASRAQSSGGGAGPGAQGDGGEAARQALAAAANDPTAGTAARAFKGPHDQVMAGRALLAKYLGRNA